MDEFIEQYGIEIFEELFDILNNKDDEFRYNECDDELCDDEGCRLNKAFKMYLKYRQMKIKIYKHNDTIRYVANNGTYQINMSTSVDKKMSEEQFRELANYYFNKRKDV